MPRGVSQNAILPRYNEHEALVCAAFLTACNAGALTGHSLEELLTRFVSELIIPNGNQSYPELEVVSPINWNGTFTGKFVFGYGSDLPRDVHEALGTTQSARPPNSMSVDAVVFDSDLESYKIIVEAKTSNSNKNLEQRIK